MKKITELTAELAAPAIAEQGCTLWDVEYVKEAGTWYLRILLDKEGGVDILDCEEISRKVSDLLDKADPIEGSYTLEVGSAGAERALKRPSDFQQFLGSPVLVKLYRAREGRKEFAGYLKGYDEATGVETIQDGADGPAIQFVNTPVADGVFALQLGQQGQVGGHVAGGTAAGKQDGFGHGIKAFQTIYVSFLHSMQKKCILSAPLIIAFPAIPLQVCQKP